MHIIKLVMQLQNRLASKIIANLVIISNISHYGLVVRTLYDCSSSSRCEIIINLAIYFLSLVELPHYMESLFCLVLRNVLAEYLPMCSDHLVH